jgi:hypothetical protein
MKRDEVRSSGVSSLDPQQLGACAARLTPSRASSRQISDQTKSGCAGGQANNISGGQATTHLPTPPNLLHPPQLALLPPATAPRTRLHAKSPVLPPTPSPAPLACQIPSPPLRIELSPLQIYRPFILLPKIPLRRSLSSMGIL